ncbi:serine hydrolase domain-containing protein [Pseudopedobacter saltans]|nr:serine hydrolase domain-containing protein [Pseudopedobacter saltans]
MRIKKSDNFLLQIKKTFRQKLIACFASILFLLYLSLSGCQNKSREPINFSSSRIHTLDSFANAIKELYNIPGLAFAIVHKDSVYSNTIGIKNNNGERLTINTPISMGHLSEPMLAFSVLKLAEFRKIDIKDKVIEYLPYFKMGGNGYEDITIKHLMTHTSGIDNYSLFYDTPSFEQNAPETTTRSIASQLPKWNLPEIQILRSPYNYDILADVISKVMGEPFENYIKKSVFTTLKMDSSYFYKTKKVARPFSTTDFLDYSYKQKDIYPYNRENGGSIGLHASVKDLSTWIHHILNQDNNTRLFGENFLKAQFLSTPTSGIGFGWDVYKDAKGIEVFTKSSEFGGFSSQLVLIPSKKIGTIIITNINSNFDPAKFSGLLASWLNNQTDLKAKAPIYITLGKKLKETGSMDSVFTCFQNLKTKPEFYDFSEKAALQFGSNLLHQAKLVPQAIEFFTFCTKEYPTSSKTYLNLAEAYLFNKDIEKCRVNIAKANTLPDKSGDRLAFVKYLNERIEVIEEKNKP